MKRRLPLLAAFLAGALCAGFPSSAFVKPRNGDLPYLTRCQLVQEWRVEADFYQRIAFGNDYRAGVMDGKSAILYELADELEAAR